jgi:hypothetical protein
MTTLQSNTHLTFPKSIGCPRLIKKAHKCLPVILVQALSIKHKMRTNAMVRQQIISQSQSDLYQISNVRSWLCTEPKLFPSETTLNHLSVMNGWLQKTDIGVTWGYCIPNLANAIIVCQWELFECTTTDETDEHIGLFFRKVCLKHQLRDFKVKARTKWISGGRIFG